MIQKMLLMLSAGVLLGGGITWLVLGTVPSYDVDPAAVARGKPLYKVCAACHGFDGAGNPDMGAPRLAGQYPSYIEQQLLNFRAGRRGVDSTDLNGLVMRPQAEALADDRAVSDVAAYIATLRR